MMDRSALLALCAALMLWAAPADAKNIGDSLMVIQTDENGVPIVGGGGGGAVTEADGANVALGATTDAAVPAGDPGTISGKVRNIAELLDALNTTLSTLNAKLPSAGLMAEDGATPTLSELAVYPKVFDGTNWDFMRKADSGSGVTGSATQRVVVASDSGVCNPKDTAQVAISVSASGNTELVALTSGQTIYICDVVLSANGTVTATLIYGTGTACGTGETSMLPQDLTAQVGYTGDFGGRLKGAAANALCLDLSGAVAVKGVITYRKMASL